MDKLKGSVSTRNENYSLLTLAPLIDGSIQHRRGVTRAVLPSPFGPALRFQTAPGGLVMPGKATLGVIHRQDSGIISPVGITAFAKGIVAEGFCQACALKLAGALCQVAFVIKLKTQILDVLVAIGIACADGVDQAIG